MNNDISNIRQDISSRLSRLRTQWKICRGLENAFYGIALILAGGILLTAAETAVWAPPKVKILLLLILAAPAGYFALRSLISLSSVFLKPNSPDDAEIAGWAGEKVPHLKDRLRNAIQIVREVQSVDSGYSQDLAAESFREAAGVFSDADLRGIIDRSRVVFALRLFVISAALWSFLLIPPMSEGLFRLANPLTAFQRPLPFSLTISPGDLTVIEGDTIVIECRAIGGSPDEITFCKSAPSLNAESSEAKITAADRDSVFRFKVTEVSESFTYWAESGRVKTPGYTIEVRNPPAVRSLRVSLEPPAYTGFPGMELDENIGDLLVFPGTGVEFKIRARGELAEAQILWSGEGKNDTITLTPRLNEASGKMRIFESGTYRVQLRDYEGLTNRFPIEYSVEVLPDLPPVVSIVQPGADLELSGTGLLKILIEAEDDFGIGKVEFLHRQMSPFDTGSSKMFHIMSLNFKEDADGVQRAEHLWDLEQMTLLPGDIVEYYARVYDNDIVMGPKSADSKIFILRLPTMEEIFSEMEEAEDASLKNLEESLEKSREIHEEIEKAIEEIRRKGDLDWSEKREQGEKINQQEKALEKLESAKESLEEIMQKAEESSMLSLELLQKYNELQKLMSEVASPELMKAMAEMQSALEQADPEQLRKAAEKFQMSQEEMLQRIEKSLEILNQLKLERQLEELAARAEEMAERQDDIADSLMTENDADEQVQREQQLKREMEDFQQKLEETSDFAAERDSLTAEELSEIGEQSENIPEEMEEMSGQMRSGEKQKAESQGRQISQKLQKLSQQLSQSKQSMVSRKKEELSGQMMAAVRDLVSLSQLQEELKQESADMPVQSPRFRDQASLQSGLREGLEKVINKLFELSQQTFFITPEIGKSLGQSGAMMESAMSNYTNRLPRDVSSQQSRAVESMNRASVQILDAVDKMQGSSSSTGFSELMEQLQQMASQQAGLNQQTQDMMMPMPGEGGSMPMEQPGMGQMGRLAAEQRALQRAMEEAAQRAEELGGVLGDLGQAGDQMGEVADSLEDRHAGERTLRLQEKILSRLLDAQKSVRTQKLSRERQSKTGQDLARRSPGEIPADELEEMLRRDIMKAMKEGYSPDYQKLIRDYYRAYYRKANN